MSEVTNLKIEVDGSEIATCIDMLDRLAEAASTAEAALRSLNGNPHGGITVDVVGSVAHIEIKPSQ